MKITTTITVEVQRADGTSTMTTERHEHTCGDSPRYEPDECTSAVEAAIIAINRRIAAGAAR